jgi:hypothetical protein
MKGGRRRSSLSVRIANDASDVPVPRAGGHRTLRRAPPSACRRSSDRTRGACTRTGRAGDGHTTCIRARRIQASDRRTSRTSRAPARRAREATDPLPRAPSARRRAPPPPHGGGDRDGILRARRPAARGRAASRTRAHPRTALWRRRRLSECPALRHVLVAGRWCRLLVARAPRAGRAARLRT